MRKVDLLKYHIKQRRPVLTNDVALCGRLTRLPLVSLDKYGYFCYPKGVVYIDVHQQNVCVDCKRYRGLI